MWLRGKSVLRYTYVSLAIIYMEGVWEWNFYCIATVLALKPYMEVLGGLRGYCIAGNTFTCTPVPLMYDVIMR